MLKLVNFYNGKRNCYVSLYSFELSQNSYDYTNTDIDKILFDFDSPKSFDNVKLFHKYLQNLDICHYTAFTGRGFHTYIMTEGKNIKHKKQALAAAQLHYANQMNFSVGYDHDCDIDKHIMGDISRITRFPYTKNLRTGLYSIPLPQDFQNLNLSDIHSLATTATRISNFICGTKLVDLHQFDNGNNDFDYSVTNIETLDDNITEDFPPCIKVLLNRKDCGWPERYPIIVYLRDSGLSELETTKILEKYLSPEKFRHSIFEERQVFHLYSKKNNYFVNKRRFQEHGCCVDCDICEIDKLYKKYDSVNALVSPHETIRSDTK